MPPYPHLLEKEIDFDGLTTKLRTLKQLGTPYSEETVKNAASIARKQAQAIANEVEEQGGPTGLENKKIMALVAYLQSLGTDVAEAEDDVANAESTSDDADVTADASR